jgi:L-iditol 2-dehydrogenase
VRENDRVLVIGVGPIGLMLVRLSVLKGARVTAAARRKASLDVASAHGASETLLLHSGEAGLIFEAEPTAPFDVVLDAGGASETTTLAIRAVGRGGTVSLFAGCPDGTKVDLDVTRVHYDELRILGSFHHTPASFRESFRLIASGAVEPKRFVTARKSLTDLPASLITPAPGALKTLVTF